MKEEINKYLESQTRINEQTLKMRKIGLLMSILLIVMGLIGVIIAAILI